MKKVKEYKSCIDNVRLVREKSDVKKIKVTDSQTAADYVRQFYQGDIGVFESAYIIILNRNNNTMGVPRVSQGGVAGTVMDPKIIVKYAVDTLASAIIMIHNHPSGNLVFSDADKRITGKVKTALEYFDIQVTDHLVITQDSYVSMADQGLL